MVVIVHGRAKCECFAALEILVQRMKISEVCGDIDRASGLLYDTIAGSW